MALDSITESPVRLSDILGAAQIGDLAVQNVELGQSGNFPIGTVMALVNGKVIGADATLVDDLFGTLVEERSILDINSERKPSVPVARHGTFKAEMLHVAVGSSLVGMAPRLRELGILLEGLEASVAPPFRIRTLVPNDALPNAANVEVIVNCDGSVPDTATVLFNNVAVVPPCYLAGSCHYAICHC